MHFWHYWVLLLEVNCWYNLLLERIICKINWTTTWFHKSCTFLRFYQSELLLWVVRNGGHGLLNPALSINAKFYAQYYFYPKSSWVAMCNTHLPSLHQGHTSNVLCSGCNQVVIVHVEWSPWFYAHLHQVSVKCRLNV